MLSIGIIRGALQTSRADEQWLRDQLDAVRQSKQETRPGSTKADLKLIDQSEVKSEDGIFTLKRLVEGISQTTPNTLIVEARSDRLVDLTVEALHSGISMEGLTTQENYIMRSVQSPYGKYLITAKSKTNAILIDYRFE